MYTCRSLLSSRDTYQGLPRHCLRLLNPQEVEGGGGDVGEDAVVAEAEALHGDYQGDGIEGVGGVGGTVGLEHVVAVAVVGGDDAGAAFGGDGVDDLGELGVHRFQGLDGGGDHARMSHHVRVGEVDDPEAVVALLPVGDEGPGGGRGAHLRLVVVGGDVAGGFDQAVLLPLELLLPAAVEE